MRHSDDRVRRPGAVDLGPMVSGSSKGVIALQEKASSAPTTSQ